MGCDESKQSNRTAEPIGTLHYFDVHGRSEYLRLMLCKADANFIDHRFGFAEWGALKPTMTGGSVPNWEEKGVKMNETTAIGRYLGKKLGFYPTMAKQAWEVDCVSDFLYEKWGTLNGAAFTKKTDDETTKEVMAATKDIIERVTAKLTKNPQAKFLCGNRLTIPDFQMVHIIWTCWKNPIHNCGDHYTVPCEAMMMNADPKFTAYVMNLHKEFKPILESRKGSPF